MSRARILAALGLFNLTLLGCSSPPEESVATSRQALTGSVTVNAATRYQTFQGFGVNAQPENWGSQGGAFAATADAMVSDLGFNIFRVEIEDGSSNWETTNDDADLSHPLIFRIASAHRAFRRGILKFKLDLDV